MKKNLYVLAVAILSGALMSWPVNLRADGTTQTNLPDKYNPLAWPPVKIPVVDEAHQAYPATRKAILALLSAKAELRAADNDFEGHREATIQQINGQTGALRSLLQVTANELTNVVVITADETHMAYPATHQLIVRLAKAKNEIAAADNDFSGQRDATVEQIDNMIMSLNFLLQDAPAP